MCGTVGVVFQGENVGLADLVSLEIDDAVFSAIAAATVTNGNSTCIVAAGIALHGFQKALLRSNLAQPAEVGGGHATVTGCGRVVSCLLYTSRCV